MIPQAYNIFDDQEWALENSWPLCTEEDEYYCMMELLNTNVKHRNEVCPSPCIEVTYQTTSKSISHDVSYSAVVLMYYQSEKMHLLEEYLIFDFSSILVAVGGSLGLFLGFSFFQCGSAVMHEFMTHLMKLSPISRVKNPAAWK